MTFLYVLAAIVMFGILITVHESGHFFAARLCKIPVREFSIGFGPSFFRRTSGKHGTEFHLRLIPLGGYCAFYGEDDVLKDRSDDPRTFSNHPVARRLLVIVMGSLMNLALAFLAAVLFYALSGIPQVTGAYTTQVQTVSEDSPAEAAGLMAGDRITSVNGALITNNLSELINEYSYKGALPLQIRIARLYDGMESELDLEVTPLYDQRAGRYMMGIEVLTSRPVLWKPGGVGEVLGSAYAFCRDSGLAIIDALKNLLTRGEGASEMTGIVGIIQLVVEETRETQLQGYLSLMTLISINLGLFNLLPIPGLDGSRLLFLLVEALRGKPIKREAYVHAAGMILLFALMALISFRDILRLF